MHPSAEGAKATASVGMYAQMLLPDKGHCLLRDLTHESKRDIVLGIENNQQHWAIL